MRSPIRRLGGVPSRDYWVLRGEYIITSFPLQKTLHCYFSKKRPVTIEHTNYRLVTMVTIYKRCKMYVHIVFTVPLLARFQCYARSSKNNNFPGVFSPRRSYILYFYVAAFGRNRVRQMNFDAYIHYTYMYTHSNWLTLCYLSWWTPQWMFYLINCC
jgi:hypothetical protein